MNQQEKTEQAQLLSKLRRVFCLLADGGIVKATDKELDKYSETVKQAEIALAKLWGME